MLMRESSLVTKSWVVSESHGDGEPVEAAYMTSILCVVFFIFGFINLLSVRPGVKISL
jgi:hypothetical protein